MASSFGTKVSFFFNHFTTRAVNVSKGQKMPFSGKCASQELHPEWGIPPSDTSLKLTSKVTVPIREKLLELMGKKMDRKHEKRIPKFCALCIAKVLELYPYLEKKEPLSLTDVLKNREPSAKRMRTEFLPPAPEESKPTEAEDISNETADTRQQPLIDVGALTKDERSQLAYDLGKL